MRYRHEEKVYDSRWEDVTAAFWQKYPNPSAPNVKSVDPIARELDEANKVLKLRRLMSLEYQMPGWMERIFGCKMTGLALEETTVDYANKILELKSRNLGLLRFLRTEETCRFEVHPDSPEKTRYTTTLGIKVHLPGSGGGSTATSACSAPSPSALSTSSSPASISSCSSTSSTACSGGLAVGVGVAAGTSDAAEIKAAPFGAGSGTGISSADVVRLSPVPSAVSAPASCSSASASTSRSSSWAWFGGATSSTSCKVGATSSDEPNHNANAQPANNIPPPPAPTSPGRADGAPAGAVTPPAASSSSSWACGFGLQAVLENQFLSRAKEKAKVGFEVMKEKIEQTKNPEWPGFVSREQWERFVAEESELLRHKKDELREQICQKTQEWEKAVEDTILEKKESLREKKEEFCKTWSAKTDELLHEVEDLKSEVERKVSEGMKSVSGAGGGGCCGELSTSLSLAEGDEPQAQPVAGNGAGSSGGGANMGSFFRKNVRAWLPFVTRLT